MNELLRLASCLPTGLNDPLAGEKFRAEFEELQAELHKGDRVGALLEAADCLYYAYKAIYNNLWNQSELNKKTACVYSTSGFTPAQVERAAIAKYTLRARPGNPKNDAEERSAVRRML